MSDLLAWINRRLQASALARLLPANRRAESHRAAADLARDCGDWAQAAAEYEKSLVVFAHRHELWIQLGNMRKEMGDLVGSRAAYDKALVIVPEDSDLALQLGHLTKIQGDVEEAKRWYRKALAFDARNYHASEELVRLGEDWSSISQLVADKPTPIPPLRKRSVVSAADVTAAWAQAGEGRPLDRGTIWFLELALAIAETQPDFAFVVRRGEISGTGLTVLSDKSVAWLAAMVRLGVFSEAKPEKCPGSNFAFANLVLLSMPTIEGTANEARTLYRGLRAGRLVTVMAIFPPRSDMPTSVSANAGAVAALLEQATMAVTMSDSEADYLRFQCRRIRPDLRVAVLRGARDDRVQPREADQVLSSIQPARLHHLFIPSRDFVEFQQIVDVWAEQAPAGARLFILVDQPTDEERKFIEGRSAHRDIIFAPADVDAVRELLATAESVLVSGVRGASLLWIQDSLARGTPVIAGVSPAIFNAWGAAISDYCNLSDRREVARRWLGGVRRMEGAGPRTPPPGGTFPWAVGARRLFSRLVEEMANGERGVAGIEIATFYSFEEIGRASGIHLLAGVGWQGTRVRSDLARRAAFIEFFARDQSAKRLCFALPVAVEPGATVNLKIEEIDGAVLSTIDWTAPASGRGWIVGDYPTRAQEGAFTAVRLYLDVGAEDAPRASRLGSMTVGGIFVFPRDLDRVWFQFLETQSDGLLPAHAAPEAV